MRLLYTKFFLLLTVLLFTAGKLLAQKYEAENAVLAGGASKQSCASCSGGSAVAQQEGSLTFTINIPETAFYNFYINASAPGDKLNIISIDGTSGDFSVKQSSEYKKVKIVSTHKLSAGQHKIEIKKSWGWITIDYLELEKVDASSRFNIDQTLVTPDPIPEATALYGFLLDHYNKRIISGGMTLNDINNSTWLDWIKTKTGEEVALLGIDFMHSGRGHSWYDDEAPIKDAETWYNRNGIPALMWHWADPLRTTNEFYTDKTNFDVSKIADVNSPEYAAMLADIDFVSGMLKKLQEKGVPVVWRPLHEAAGGWFWWGAKGPEPLKALWHLMFDRMVNHHGLRNLIWVWTAEPGDDAWYPGDEYVDIIGRDIYKDGDHSSHVLEFNSLNDRFGGNKMIALSENGSFPDVDNLLKDEAGWLWFMPWYKEYTTDSKYNSVALWQKMMNHEYVITLDEMPDLRSYQRQEVSEPTRPEDPSTPPTWIWDRSFEALSFTVYPTVVDSYLYLEGDKRIESIVIYNLLGTIVKHQIENEKGAVVSFEGLQPGVYLLRINGTETVRVLKK